MKFLKNKAKKALMAAVTMSLVMGVCGSAMAADSYLGTTDGKFEKKVTIFDFETMEVIELPENPAVTGFNGEWTATSGDGDGVANIIYGGKTTSDEVSKNKVTVSGGTVDEVYGGYSKGGNAKDNTVNIRSENKFKKVTGGEGAVATNNTVNIIQGAFYDSGSVVYGGYSNGGNAKDNTVCIGGYIENGQVFTAQGTDAPGLKVYGGYAIGGTSSGNTVKVMSVDNNIRSLNMETIQNLEFYIPAGAKNGNTMLTVKSDVNLKDVTVKAGVDGNNKNLKVNDTVKLIVGNGDAKITNFADATTVKLDVDGFATFGLTIEQPEENVLQATITEVPKEPDPEPDPKPEPKPDPINHDAAKSPVETRVVVATILNTGADMLATAGFDNAASAVASEVNAGGSVNVMTPFMAMGGTKAKIKSGSHVDVKGWNMNLGLAKEIDNKAGKLLIGPVVEYGRGSYDSYVNDVHGEGDSHFWGAGVMAKQTNDSGFYYEGSLRAGKASSDYQNKAVAGHSYDSDAAYWAAHVGVGKIVKLGEKDNLDYYGKFFYSHQKGDDVTTKSGTDFHFDATKSVRTRLGMRLNHEMDAKNALYAGLAWQREFDGDATATITVLGNNYSTPAPSIKGNTGIMELGWKVNANKNLDLDLGATGYTGKQKGASLNLALNFKF